MIDVTDERLGLGMLVNGRVRVFMVVENVLRSILQEEEFRNESVREIGVVDRFWIHPYMHRKHKFFSVQLAKILKGMKEEGIIKNLPPTATSSI